METGDFVKYFEKVPHLVNHFLGVFPIDKIPQKMKKKTFFICNLDPSFKPGSHWICFLKFLPSECEIFDSLGANLSYLLPFIKFKQKTCFVFNNNPVQDTSSHLCGMFVIMFVIERFFNQTMNFGDIVEEIFSKNKLENDLIVAEFCKTL